MSMPCGIEACPRRSTTGLCFIHKPKKPMRAKRPMKKVGRVGQKLIDQSKQWRQKNPPNHQGYYVCYMCGRWILPEEMNVEHTKSKVRHPELRFDEGKLKPACGDCNEKKGSNDE